MDILDTLMRAGSSIALSPMDSCCRGGRRTLNLDMPAAVNVFLEVDFAWPKGFEMSASDWHSETPPAFRGRVQRRHPLAAAARRGLDQEG